MEPPASNRKFSKKGTLTMSWIESNLGIPSGCVADLTSRGLFPAVRVGRQWLISPENVERWLNEKIWPREQRLLSSILSDARRRTERLSNRVRNRTTLGLREAAAPVEKEAGK
jgi:excisionase family DNA binding protein